MTIDQLIDTLGSLWPRHCTPAWAAAWAPQYAAILGNVRPDALAKAWRDTIAAWTYPKPPQPGDILKHVAARSMDFGDRPGQPGGKPLTFGRAHFATRKAIAERIYAHWRTKHADLAGDDPLGLCCRSEAWLRALATAGRLVDAGHAEPSRGDLILWTDDDTALCRARMESRRRVAPKGGSTAGPIKALHVRRLDDGTAVMERAA